MTKTQEESDKRIQRLVGELIFWCGRVEFQLRRVLAHALFSKESIYRNFELVNDEFKNIEINKICNIIIMLKNIHNIKMEDDCVDKIKFYISKQNRQSGSPEGTTSVRNSIVHSFFYINDDFCVCKNIDNANDGEKHSYWPSGRKAQKYRISDIEEHIFKTQALYDALEVVAIKTWKIPEG